MSELPNTKNIPDVENTIRGSEPVIRRIDQNSNEISTKNYHDSLTNIRNVHKIVRKEKSRVLKTSTFKKPKTVAVDNISAKKTPISKQTVSVNQSEPKKPLIGKIGKATTSVAKKVKAKVTKTSQVQGTIKKSKITESDKKPLVKEPLSLGQPLSKPISQLKKTTPTLHNLISVVKKLEVKKEKPKRILKSALKSDVKGKTLQQSNEIKTSDNSQR